MKLLNLFKRRNFTREEMLMNERIKKVEASIEKCKTYSQLIACEDYIILQIITPFTKQSKIYIADLMQRIEDKREQIIKSYTMFN